MKVSEIPPSDFIEKVSQSGITIRTGPFQMHIRTPIRFISEAIHTLYGDFPLAEDSRFADFHIDMRVPPLRRWYRQNVVLSCDGTSPFFPLPLNQGVAMLEWCLNWCISTNAHHFLIMHAAVVERDGHAAVFAAPPGSGKSTLTAALVARGWRLLSDELTLLDPRTGQITGLARPIGLKNKSIDIIRGFVADAVLGPVAVDTAKGVVAHLKPPAESVARMHESAVPRWVVFPKFEPGGAASLVPYRKAHALLQLGENAFNYGHHGAAGFECLAKVAENCDCYSFTYSRLQDAIDVFDGLVKG